ncbi:hypothetical protein KSP39_PZI017658 [Platanthera zijinensis]|uniref:Pentatricopeptide repeat-containing protein n=1 Tax=Platanthera zijinensis TaxID=2320716 RepID=A0AAP0B5E5_9ASPA
MPSTSLTFLPNPPIFSLHCSSCPRRRFRTRFSKWRTSSVSKSHNGNISPVQIISFFHTQLPSKSLQVIAIARDNKLSSNQEVELLDEFQVNSCSPQIEEPRNSRLVQEAKKIPESFAIRREIEVKDDVSKAVKKFGENLQNEQDTVILHSKDGIFMDLGRRRSRFNVLDLVKKIISLPDEERSKVLDLFDFDGSQLTVSDYNDILLALVRAGEYDSIEVLFSEFSSRGLSPDSWTLSTMIECFAKKNDPEKAMEVFDAMLLMGLCPDAYTFTGLIRCLGKRGRLNQIYKVFEIMDGIGCERGVRNYNSLIYGLCYVGKIEEALQLLDKMKKFVKGPDIYTFTFVMNGLCKVGRTNEAKKLLKEALKLDLTPTNVTYNCLFNGYCREGRPLEALHLLKQREGKHFQPDIVTYTTLLQGLLKCGEIRAALTTYNKMIRADFLVDDRSVNTLIRGLCRESKINGKHFEEAKKLFDEITVKKGNEPSPYTYCLMVQTLAERGEIDAAMCYLKDMINPRIMTYNVVLRILCRKGMVNDALGVLVNMIERETMPSKFSLSILICEFKRQGRLLSSSAVYSVAIKRGVVPRCKPGRVDKIRVE